MENIIKKAIEGGYQRNWHLSQAAGTMRQHECILDPLFWQALGKACGWGANARLSPKNESSIFGQDEVNYALVFHEINLTEGWDKAVEYLESLIPKNK